MIKPNSRFEPIDAKMIDGMLAVCGWTTFPLAEVLPVIKAKNGLSVYIENGVPCINADELDVSSLFMAVKIQELAMLLGAERFHIVEEIDDPEYGSDRKTQKIWFLFYVIPEVQDILGKLETTKAAQKLAAEAVEKKIAVLRAEIAELERERYEYHNVSGEVDQKVMSLVTSMTSKE